MKRLFPPSCCCLPRAATVHARPGCASPHPFHDRTPALMLAVQVCSSRRHQNRSLLHTALKLDRPCPAGSAGLGIWFMVFLLLTARSDHYWYNQHVVDEIVTWRVCPRNVAVTVEGLSVLSSTCTFACLTTPAQHPAGILYPETCSCIRASGYGYDRRNRRLSTLQSASSSGTKLPRRGNQRRAPVDRAGDVAANCGSDSLGQRQQRSQEG